MTIHVDRVATGFDQPTAAAAAPGDPDRLFVTEKETGRVRILDLASGNIAPQPFFDVPQADLTSESERGLLGITFDPDYVRTGHAYLHLTNEVGDAELWEITRSATNPDV